MPKLPVQTLWFTANTCFSSGSFESWLMLDGESLCDQSPVKMQSSESLISWMTFHLCVHNSWQEELTASHVTPLGEDFYLLSFDSATHTFPLWWFYFC